MATNKNIYARAASLAAAVALVTLVAGCGPPGPRALLKGKRLVEQGKYPQAVERLNVATRLLSTNAQAWNYLGLAYHHAGQPVDATEAYRKALKLNRDMTAVRYNLGCLMLEQGNLTEARNEFTAYTLQQGKSVVGWVKLGTVQLRLREIAGAEKSFKEALRLNADNPEALNCMGLLELQRNRPREAVACFNSALARQPDYGPSLLNLAIVSQTSNDRETALKKYRAYLALKPKAANWDAVNVIAKQLEQDLKPAPRPAPVVQPKPAVTNPPPRSNLTPASVTRPEAVTNVARPVAVASRPAPAPTPVPDVKPEIVRVPDGPVVRVAEAAPPTPRPTVAPAPVRETVQPPEPARPVVVPQLVGGARYNYASPSKPADGNRAGAERVFAQAAQAQRDKRMKEAVALYRAAAQADPGYFEAQSALATTASEQDDMAQALPAYEVALAIKPDSFSTRFNFALALRKVGYLQDSAQELERLLASYGAGETPARLAAAHLTLGNMYATQFRQPAAARPHYLKVLALDPQNPQGTDIRYWLRDNP